jgi:prepilin-type processing-associated H-X9-DG protein
VPPGGYAGDSAQDWTGWWWFNYIGQFYDQRYTKTSILFCPAKNLKGTTLEANILCGNYGVNQSVCRATSGGTDAEFVGQSLRMGEIPRPSETLLTVDAGYVLVNWWHATADPPQPLDPTYIGNTSYVPGLRINSAKDIWPRQEYDAINGRHPNKTVNAGFVDGHVENKKADALLVEKHQDEYYNRVPLWSPK